MIRRRLEEYFLLLESPNADEQVTDSFLPTVKNVP
jgi:hypothetical protein